MAAYPSHPQSRAEHGILCFTSQAMSVLSWAEWVLLLQPHDGSGALSGQRRWSVDSVLPWTFHIHATHGCMFVERFVEGCWVLFIGACIHTLLLGSNGSKACKTHRNPTRCSRMAEDHHLPLGPMWLARARVVLRCEVLRGAEKGAEEAKLWISYLNAEEREERISLKIGASAESVESGE